MYARGPRSSTLWAMGLTQHSTGTDIVASLLNLILATGIDRPLGRGDDSDSRPEQRAGRERRRRDPDVLHRLSDRSPIPAIRHMFAQTWGVPDERIPLDAGLKVTQIAKEGSPVRGMFIMGENPIISDPDVSHAEALVPRARVPRRAGSLPHRDRALCRRGPARRVVRREGRDVREHRAAHSARRRRPSIRRARRAAISRS